MNVEHITSARYNYDSVDTEMKISITITYSGQEIHVPLCVGNTDYDDLMEMVSNGELTIAEAE